VDTSPFETCGVPHPIGGALRLAVMGRNFTDQTHDSQNHLPGYFQILKKEKMLKSKSAAVKPPKHLRPATSQWFSQIIADYELESHHIRLLTKACESWDRSEQAREGLLKHGLTFEDRFGSPHARPEIAIERDSRLAFARLIREIGLDVSTPTDTRPNSLPANRI
jgi:phage terminase small subunit